jgi:hypothetical protein
MRSPKREHGMCSHSPRKGERPRSSCLAAAVFFLAERPLLQPRRPPPVLLQKQLGPPVSLSNFGASRIGVSVLARLAPCFYNRPVRIWPICHPEGAVGTYTPRCRGQRPCNIPRPLCSPWWGDSWQLGRRSSRHIPSQIAVLGCAISRAGARSMTWELGAFLLHTNHLRTVQVF